MSVSKADQPEVLPNGDSSGGCNGAGRKVSNLAKLKISPDGIRALPSEFVKRHRVLPLQIHNSTIDVATAELGNQRVIDDIRLLTGLEVQEFEAPAAEILEKIAECYQVTAEQMI